MPRATLAALVLCRALLKSSAPGEGSPNWSHVDGLASLSFQNIFPASLIVWQWGSGFAVWEQACLVLWGQGSTAISPQLCSLS